MTNRYHVAVGVSSKISMISKCVRKNKNGTARVAERQMRKPLPGKLLPFIIQVLKPMGFLQGIVKAFYRSRKLGIINRC